MNNKHNALTSISWQLKRIADALEEMNERSRPQQEVEDVDYAAGLKALIKSKEKS